MAQTMHCRPSSLLGIADRWVAFCVDRASWTFATEVERAQNEAVNRLPKNAKDAAHTRARQRVLDTFLGYDASADPQRFRKIG